MTQDSGRQPNVRVLIADDQRPTRQGLRALLSLSPQVEVIGEAMDGQESVALVSEHHPDVVLMDVRMPVMDGLEATRRIKSQWPEVKVITLTMHPKYRSQALAAGADVFLLKGCPVEELQAAILAAVQSQNQFTKGV
jgi:DNA-binding NarL/FixJ family response regulator